MSSLVAAVIVLILVAAMAGAYFLLASKPSQPTSAQTFIPASSTTSSGNVASSASTASSSPGSGGESFGGTFAFVTPLGPSGISGSSGTLVQWNSTQRASGTFTFSINPSTYVGGGSGNGSITVQTVGYCSGSVTVQYGFNVTATHVPGSNIQVAFELSKQSNANITVPLSCQGPTTGFFTANNPVTYLPVWPNLISFAVAPYTDSQPLTGGISYTVTVSQVDA